ncbi:hypothetical protein [Alteromonas confluentis]|uniref:Uncharacterized protein n=1 Tax=Alteromonas confluentis TaxID=1656094 RepID=A0A1E7Z6Y8_9ALTE|nr:hypothetical protein [Alteromonas confluentis]OFC69247.1 hypothetical protein BFC18_21285 [Alteromonas confluentis]
MQNSLKLFCSALLLNATTAGATYNHHDFEEKIYFSDTMQKFDGVSTIYRIELDTNAETATLIPLQINENSDGIAEYDHIDVLASSTDGNTLWMINSLYAESTELLKYNVQSTSLESIGLVSWDGPEAEGDADQAAVAPNGDLYITRKYSNFVYRLDTTTAQAEFIGEVTDTNLNGGDISFGRNGVLYMKNYAGLFILDIENVSEQNIPAEMIGTSGVFYTGLANRDGGYGNLLVSNREDSTFEEVSPDSGLILKSYIMLTESGAPYSHQLGGDMATGPFQTCNRNVDFWKNNSWRDQSITINGLHIDEIVGRFGTKSEGREPYNGMLWNTRNYTYSKVYAQLIAAKLNTFNSSNSSLINSAESFLRGKSPSKKVKFWDIFHYTLYKTALYKFNKKNKCK